jgi:cytochrome c-type biogenesis protein CcmE
LFCAFAIVKCQLPVVSSAFYPIICVLCFTSQKATCFWSNFAAAIKKHRMKTSHILILVVIAVAIGILISSMGDLSTYDTIDSAKAKPGKFLHLIAKLDTANGKEIEYDALKDPNYLAFHVVDSLGGATKVVYMKGKPPTGMERSERMVLKGKMTDSAFLCDDILIKCPSKYKEEKAKISTVAN